MAELRERVTSRCSIDDPETGKVIGGDLGSLLLKMLLFEENIIDSTYLREFPSFIELLGAEQLILLIKEGKVQIKCDSRTLGDYGTARILPEPQRGSLRVIGTFRIDLAWNYHTPLQWFSDALGALLNQLELPRKTASRLEEAIAEHCILMPADFGNSAITQLARDIEANHNELLQRALAHVLEIKFGFARADASTVCAEIYPLGDGSCNVATNLNSFGVDREQYDIVQTALFAVGSFYFRLEEMQDLRSISGFQPDELPLFEAKVDLLARQLIPDAQAERFRKVLTIADLPDPSQVLQSGQTIDIEHFLKIRNAAECQQFRTWLRTLDDVTDQGVKHQVSSLKAKTAEIVQSTPGRVIRFGTVTGAGFIPGIGVPLGIGLGAIDGFVVDRLIGEPGPAVFLSRHYRSIFDH
jgi:hypothetical protein